MFSSFAEITPYIETTVERAAVALLSVYLGAEKRDFVPIQKR